MAETRKTPWWATFFTILGLTWTLLWTGILFYVTYPFLNSMYQITKIPTSYFAITVTDHKASYRQVDTPPAEWVPLEKISKRLRGAIIASEDGKFYEHPGYDIEELQKALDKGVVKKKKLRGASTITQQLIKNLYFQSDRSFWRKIQEMALTLWIEDHVSKNKILEVYLNIVEYGEGLYGIKNAAQFYFKKAPEKLTARESAFLAMLLPSPKKYAQSFRRRSLTSFASGRIQSILFKMLQGGKIGIDEYYQNLEGRFSWEAPREVTGP